MNVLETSSVFAVLMVAAILLVKRGSRKLKPRNGRSSVFWEKKPIPEENEEDNFFQVIYEPAKIILESFPSILFQMHQV